MLTNDLEYIHKIMASEALSQKESYQAFEAIVTGEMESIQLSALLTALKMKGETSEEIAGAARALIDHAVAFPKPDYVTADNCGTGGDGSNTINISTLCAILAAACGVKMAKHGNRKVSSKSGSADVLSELGIKLDMSPAHARHCLDETNLTFLMAPVYHSGIRHAMPVRQTLATRTIFNILGPLVNPAEPAVKIVGVYSPDLCLPVAEALKALGVASAWVVHGSGVDEIALHGATQIAELKKGEITEFELTPETFGFNRQPISALRGGTPTENAANIRQILAGDGIDAHNAAVVMNTAPILLLYGLAPDLTQACELAKSVLLSGKGLETLNTFVTLSHQPDESHQPDKSPRHNKSNSPSGDRS